MKRELLKSVLTKGKILMLLMAGMPVIAQAADILVEAEQFSDRGGWVVDQQFMDQMGSPYLLAHGAGVPVEDAVTIVRIPVENEYNVYVRTYNWTSPWSSKEGPGKFRISVGGRALNCNLGTVPDKWEWQRAGRVKLKRGQAEIRLRDITGFDGRCDAVFLTTSDNLPPEGKELEQLRYQTCNPETPEILRFDYVVIGGGMAGISAAVSAARLGCRVALVHDRPVLGGNNSSEVRVHLGGRIGEGRYPRVGDLVKEIGPDRGGNAAPADFYEDDKKLSVVKAEKNIHLLMPYHAVSVEHDSDMITAVIAQDTYTGRQVRLEAPLFADCTGDGTIGYKAGAAFMTGREDKEYFGESIAPEMADTSVMGASVQWYSDSVKNNKKIVFPEFSYGLDINDSNCENVFRSEWTWETGMDFDQVRDSERIRDYGLLVVYSNWSWLKNHSAHKKDFANKYLSWVEYVAGKRESRRLVGDYILHEDDILKNVRHEDASFTTTWSIDLHQVDKKNSSHFPNEPFKSVTKHINIYPYSVPYRCLYSKNIHNLFMAGRDISVSHVALGTVRVMRTTAQMGEVTGMAASLCVKYGITPREVYMYRLDELKELMTNGVGNPALPHKQNYNLGGTLKNPPVANAK